MILKPFLKQHIGYNNKTLYIMRILWIINNPTPEICSILGFTQSPSGGWILSLLDLLNTQSKDLKFAVATVVPCKKVLKYEIKGITYYCLPCKQYPTKYYPELEKYWEEINTDFKPNVVHIHGSEFTHGYAYIKSCGNDNVILSIQGLVSVINQFYLAGLTQKELKKYLTLRDFIKGGVIKAQKKITKSAKYEEKYFKLIKHVIGRTAWDKIHTKAINPNINYHFCNETLRESFYCNEWNINKCTKHSIFISQTSSPLKGFHKVLEALPYVINKFPDTQVFVAGRKMYTKSFLEKQKNTSYANYITHLINKNGLNSHIHFLGFCNEEEMVKQYLKSHVFICPSSIENSPNSIGEAQLLGVPCIASYVGGIPDMIEHEKNGFLYRFEETQMLAEYICTIFSDDNFALKISYAAKQTAKERHKKETILATITNIYKDIAQ